MSEPVVTCVVAEDEALLREALVEQLGRAWPPLRIVAECEDGASALEAIAGQRPDVAFLDIRMPGLTGLDVAAAGAGRSPERRIGLVPASDQHATAAFGRGAVDSLHRRVRPERLAATVQRVRGRLGEARDEAPAALLAKLGRVLPRAASAPEPLTWLTASAGRETRLILVDEVAYFRADHKYTTVVTADGEALLRTSIRELLARLDPAVFKQVHRSTVVNMKAVAGVTRDDAGRGVLRLRGRPETLTVSAPFMALFRPA